MKRRGDKIVMVTAYDMPGARFAEDAGVDIDPRRRHGGDGRARPRGHDGARDDGGDAVPHAHRRACGAPADRRRATCRSARTRSPTRTRCANAIRFVKEARADVVKLEGAGPMVRRVRAIVEAGIPVIGHIGLTPQSATLLGGFKTQGKTAEAARGLVEDALALEAAGCFVDRARGGAGSGRRARSRGALRIPTIGIGAGAGCDGQVLVYHDLLGLTEGHLPRFVKRYANLSREIRDALEAYASDVRSGAFPEQSTPTRCRRRSSRIRGRLKPSSFATALARPGAAAMLTRCEQRGPVHPCTARMPSASSRAPTARTRRARPASTAPGRRRSRRVRKRSPPNAARPYRPKRQRQRTGAHANASDVARPPVAPLPPSAREAPWTSAPPSQTRARRRARRRKTPRRRRRVRRASSRRGACRATDVARTPAMPTADEQPAPAPAGRAPPRRVVAQRREDRPRRLQNEQRAKHPIPVERLLAASRRGHLPKATRAPEVEAGPPGCTRRRRPRCAYP